MHIWYTITTITLLLFVSCSMQFSGVSDHPNECTGVVTLADGTPAAGVVVTLLPNEYNHAADSSAVAARVVLTDECGNYTFDSLPEGDFAYTIEAQSRLSATAAIVRGVKTVTQETEVEPLVLQFSGNIYFAIEATELKPGMIVYLPGVRYFKSVGSDSAMLLSNVPAGIVTLKAYDPDTREVLDLGSRFISIDIVSGGTLILPTQTPVPYCLKNGTGTGTFITGHPGEVLTFSPINLTGGVDGRYMYRFSWGDGTISEWSSDIRWEKSWGAPGIYFVQAQKMRSGTYLAWSDYLTVEIVQ